MALDPVHSEPPPGGAPFAGAPPSPAGDQAAAPGLAAAALAALRYLTGFAPRTADQAAALGRGGLFFPAIGLVLGVAIAWVARAASPFIPPVVIAPAVVALLLVPQRGATAVALLELATASSPPDAERPPSAARVALASALLAGVFVAKALALLALAGPALGPALVLAILLARWAPVVQAYGSIPAADDPLAAPIVRRLGFNEFAIASVSAMAAALALADAVGLVLLFAVASGAIVVRILAHRRGGIRSTSLLFGIEVAETTVLILCAALTHALGSP